MSYSRLKLLVDPALRAMITSVVINTALYFTGTTMGIISLDVPVTPDGQVFSLPPVIVASIIPIILAVLIFWAMSLWMTFYKRWFLVLASVLLVVSFLSPFSVPQIPFGMALLLNLMHVIVAGSVMYFFHFKYN
ncbi:MAG: DUF6069 family protein [Bacteroidota bacterium]